MPFDSNGVFSRVMNWTSDQQNGIAIECGRHDAEDNNFAEGFNETFCRDGRAAATGNFNLGNHKIQNLADGIAATDAVTKGQLDASSAAGVTLNTAQTITGTKTFSGTQILNGTTLKCFGFERGTNPQTNQYVNFYTTDSTATIGDNTALGLFRTRVETNGKVTTLMRAFKNNVAGTNDSADIQVIYPASGSPYTYAPTPTEDTNNSNQIDTVGARNTKLGNYVTLGTEQTITGAKTFANNLNLLATANGYRHIYSNNTSITKGTAPSTNTGTDIVLRDSAGSNISTFTTWYNTSGNINIGLNAFTPTAGSTGFAQFKVSNYASGRADIQFSTPSGVTNTCLETATASTSSEVIPTMGWVNNPATATNVVHRTGNETIDGIKTFTDNIITNIDAVRNVAPSAAKYGGLGIHDNNNNMFMSLLGSMDTNKNAAVFMRVFNPTTTTTSSSDQALLSLHYNANGSTYATAPASDVANSVVTTKSINKAAKGHVELGNGIIINWVKRTQTGSFTWSKAFTNADSYTIAADAAIGYSKTGGTSVNITDFHYGDSNKPDTVTLIAIGY